MSAGWLRLLPGYLKDRLEGRPVLQKVIGNTGWLLADKALRMGLGLVVVVWMARYLGPQQYGLLNYAIALVALFGMLANVGLDSIVVRDIVRDPANRNAILGSAFTLKLVGGVVAVLGVVATSLLIGANDDMLTWLVVLISLGLLPQAFDAIGLWFDSQIKARYAVLARNVAFVALASTKLVLVWIEAPLISFAWALLVESTLTAVALVVAYRIARCQVWDWRTNVPLMRQMLRQGWPLILSGIVVAIYMRIDQVMLGQMLGDEAVGLYSAAARISELWYLVPGAIVASAAPVLASAREAGITPYRERLERLFRLLGWLSLVVALPVSLLAEPLILLLFGTDYRASGIVLAIHVWAGFFVALGVASSQYLILEDLNHISLQRTFLGAVLNVALNLAWIPAYGVAGAAWATLVSYAVATFFLFQTRASRACFTMMLRGLWPARRRAA